jgi:hypothetical protein
MTASAPRPAIICLVAAAALSGCAQRTESPRWGLVESNTRQPPPPEPVYRPQIYGAGHGHVEYRGGRDPITGRAPGSYAERSGERTVRVLPGDTLHGIARRHGVSVEDLMRSNRLTSTTIHPGQQLALPAR